MRTGQAKQIRGKRDLLFGDLTFPRIPDVSLKPGSFATQIPANHLLGLQGLEACSCLTVICHPLHHRSGVDQKCKQLTVTIPILHSPPQLAWSFSHPSKHSSTPSHSSRWRYSCQSYRHRSLDLHCIWPRSPSSQSLSASPHSQSSPRQAESPLGSLVSLSPLLCFPAAPKPAQAKTRWAVNTQSRRATRSGGQFSPQSR